MSASPILWVPQAAERSEAERPDPGDTLAALAAPVPPLRPGASAMTAYEAFSAEPSLYAIPVVDDHGLPVGLINRFKFLETLSRPFGRDLLKNRPVAMAMDRVPLVLDEHTPLDQLSQILADDTTKYIFDGFIVTRQGRYVGIGTGFGLMRRITERRQATLAHLAYHDTLTGLPNRQLFSDRLRQTLASARRNKRRVAVLYVDLDRFKAINDDLGHTVGDLVLQATADRFRSIVRRQDTVARLGGDEFAVVLTELGTVDHADLVARKLNELVAQPFQVDGHTVDISCSIGLAAFPDHSDDQTVLLRMADDALYAAKRSRNTMRRYTAEMARPPAQGPLLFSLVRRAIELRQLEVFYQPQANLDTGALCGLEALVRWQDPIRGTMPTSELIQVAEDAGLVTEITRFVCGDAMRQFREWHEAGLADGLRLSINISGSEVRDGLLAPLLRAYARESGLPLSAIELELTESGLMHSDADAMHLLSELREEGVQVSVDDFGTGYSSLGRLQRLPVDVLKIDRSFIEEIGKGAKQGALVRAIIAMAHSLELTVVAEGVETTAQHAFLAQHGCDRFQGHLLAQPMPAGDMAQYLLEARRILSGAR
jgi:diguanylate cyclase (GGDEF)-like protein